MTRQLYLSEFAKGAPDVDMRLAPAPTTTSRGIGVQGQFRPLLSAVTTTPTGTTTPPGTPTPSGTVTPTGTGAATSTVTPTGTGTAACTVTPAGTGTPTCTVATGTVTPTDAATATATHTGALTGLLVPSDAYLRAVASQNVLADFVLDDRSESKPRAVYAVVGQTTDKDGNPLPPDEVAKRLAKDLNKVKVRNKDGKKDPLGWVVAVNVEVSGLKHVPLLLTWSLDGLDVPVRWAADNVAYRLTPTTAHDTGSVEIWVPDLKKSGEYNVNLTLALASDGTILTRGGPVKVPNK